jgi:hypothetical protein
VHVASDALTAVADLKGNPWVIWGTLIGGLFLWLASVSEAVQKLLGPLGRWIGSRQAKRAARVLALSDPRVADLVGQVKHLAPRVDLLESQLETMYALVSDHIPWDLETLDLARRVDPRHPQPPTLRPPRRWVAEPEPPHRRSTDDPPR